MPKSYFARDYNAIYFHSLLRTESSLECLFKYRPTILLEWRDLAAIIYPLIALLWISPFNEITEVNGPEFNFILKWLASTLRMWRILAIISNLILKLCYYTSVKLDIALVLKFFISMTVISWRTCRFISSTQFNLGNSSQKNQNHFSRVKIWLLNYPRKLDQKTY